MVNKKAIITVGLILALSSLAMGWNIFPSLGGSRSGTAGLTFLKINVGARGAAMGGAYSATCTDVFSLYHNPAGLIWNDRDGVAFAYRFWVADITHNFIGVSRHLNESNAIGFSLISISTDPIDITDEYHPTGTGETMNYSDFAIGATYSVKLTEYFSCGLTTKYAQETIGDLKLRAVLVDLGTLYQTDFYRTRFAINMSNFGNRVKPGGTYWYKTVSGGWIEKGYQSFSPPTVFKVSVAFDPITTGQNGLTFVTQLNHPTDNAENIATGLEYNLNKKYFIRGGYLINSKVENFSLGGGLKLEFKMLHGSVDYAYTSMRDLGGTSTFSIALEF